MVPTVDFKGCLGKAIVSTRTNDTRSTALPRQRMAFDDIEESTGIDEETHRQFFHCFIEVGSSHLFKKYVLEPVTLTDAHNHVHEMQLAGFPVCIGS